MCTGESRWGPSPPGPPREGGAGTKEAGSSKLSGTRGCQLCPDAFAPTLTPTSVTMLFSSVLEREKIKKKKRKKEKEC